MSANLPCLGWMAKSWGLGDGIGVFEEVINGNTYSADAKKQKSCPNTYYLIP
jgi:hypothetical protein